MKFMSPTYHLIPNKHYMAAFAYKERKAYGQVEEAASAIGGEVYIVSELEEIVNDTPLYVYTGYIETPRADVTPLMLKVISGAYSAAVVSTPVGSKEEYYLDGLDWSMGTTGSTPIRFLSPDSLLSPGTFYMVAAGWKRGQGIKSITEIDTALKAHGMRVSTKENVITSGGNMMFALYTEDKSTTPAELSMILEAPRLAVASEPLASGALAVIALKAEQASGIASKGIDGVLNTAESFMDLLPDNPNKPGLNWVQWGIGGVVILGLGYVGVKYWSAIKKAKK